VGLDHRVVVVVAVSIAAFATRTTEPVLGLDLKGGVSVILSAPDGTPSRHDAAGAREHPQPRRRVRRRRARHRAVRQRRSRSRSRAVRTARSQQRTVDLQCIADAKGATYGCASDATDADRRADAASTVTSKTAKVCVFAGRTARVLRLADRRRRGKRGSPQAEGTPSASASASGLASASAAASPARARRRGPGPSSASTA
jgi:preprotein translocase subunit SecD